MRFRLRSTGVVLSLALVMFVPLSAFAQDGKMRADSPPQQFKVEQFDDRKKILVHLTEGPEHPTKAALAFLVARTAVEEGHTVRMFLAGDAVQLLRDSVLDSVQGVGTGRLREHYDALARAGVRFYLSGASSKARGLTDAELRSKPAEFATPSVLLRLSIESDRMFVY